jgi:hypothetical protein
VSREHSLVGAPRYPYLHVSVAPGDAELVSFELFELGAAGVEERDATTLLGAEAAGSVTLIASFADEDAAHAARACRILPSHSTFEVVLLAPPRIRRGGSSLLRTLSVHV